MPCMAHICTAAHASLLAGTQRPMPRFGSSSIELHMEQGLDHRVVTIRVWMDIAAVGAVRHCVLVVHVQHIC